MKTYEFDLLLKDVLEVTDDQAEAAKAPESDRGQSYFGSTNCR